MSAQAFLPILDSSACLSKRQLREYAGGSMSREEAFAVESHLNGCPLCSAAADGLLAHFAEAGAVDVMAGVDAGFLKDHFSKHSPQIHLNTMAPPRAQPAQTAALPRRPRTVSLLPNWRAAALAAGVVALIAGLWWMQQSGGTAEDARPAIASADAPASSNASAPMDAAAPYTDAPGVPSAAPMSAPARSAASEEAAPTSQPNVTAPEIARAEVASPAPPNVADNSAMQQAAGQTGPKLPAPLEQRMRRYGDAVTGTGTAANAEQKTAAAAAPARKPIEAATAAASPTEDNEDTRARESAAQRSAPAAGSLDGAALYSAGNYSAALKAYKLEMQTASGVRREEAVLGAARTHLRLGQKSAAIPLLRELAAGTGPRARAARRELRALESAE